tara:strand:- start:859 stop:1074 length:216 start_codon:yes stop_codon:yes gene_type:complete
MEHSSVTSSMLSSIGYDKDEEILEIKFANGSLYRYEGVPPNEYYDLIQADSVGKHFTQHVKNAGYPYEKVG